jgi:hypothetical protein
LTVTIEFVKGRRLSGSSRIFYRQREKHFDIEWKKLWKHIIIVVVTIRRDHKYDYFNEFLFEAKDVFNANAGAIASRANRMCSLNLSKEWFLKFEM